MHSHGGHGPTSASDDYVIMPPDGGWGWVIVIAAFYCQLIIDGIQLSFGMILKEIATDYNVQYSSVSLIGSLMYGIHYLTGPLCAGLSYHYGDRPVSMAGSVVAFLGLAAPYFFKVPIIGLYLLIGIITGIGLCFVNMNSLIITTLYFSKKRILAMGIVVCGTGAGTIVFSVLAHYILKEMDWRTVCLIEGVMALTMFIAAATFRPLKPVLVQAKSKVETFELGEESDVDTSDDNQPQGSDQPVKQKRVYYVSQLENTKSRSSRESLSAFTENTGCALEDVATSFAHSSTGPKRKISGPKRRLRRIIKMNPEVKENVFDNDQGHPGVHRIQNDEDYTSTNRCEQWKHVFSTMLDCHILKSVSFCAYCVGGALSAAALIIVVFYEKVRLLEEGYSGYEVMWYMVGLGTANMFWRLVLGAVSTLPMVHYHSLNVVGLILGGSFTAASVTLHSVFFIALCGSMYGLAIACFAVFYPVALLELVGSERISNATGIAMLFMGLFSTIGAPVSGLIMERAGNIDIIFYIAGGMFIVSGIIFVFISGRRRNRGL